MRLALAAEAAADPVLAAEATGGHRRHQTAVVGPGEGFTTAGDLHTVVDTGWLLVGVAGLAGGLALVLIGAGIAAAPLLLPIGALLAVVAYLAWAAGSSRVVATVYDEVGDPDRTAAADSRTGRPEDRADPDGNWRGAAADGGAAGGRASSGQRSDGGRTTAGDDDRAGRASTGIGPDGERIWDAAERDRAGGWDDWEADWEWADRHWEVFEHEHNGPDGGSGANPRRGTTGSDGRTDRDGRRGGGAGARQRTRSDADEGARRTRRGPRDRYQGDTRSRRRQRHRDHRRQRARELLGVSADADETALRAAYRERVKETHPDRGGDPEAFKQVQWAYDYLSED